MATQKVSLSQVDDLKLLQATDADVLASGATMYGEAIYVSGYTHVTGFFYSDVASASNGIVIEQALRSSDLPAGAPATTGITRSRYSYTAADIETNSIAVQIVAPFVRVLYINGGTAQTSFKAYVEARNLRGL